MNRLKLAAVLAVLGLLPATVTAGYYGPAYTVALGSPPAGDLGPAIPGAACPPAGGTLMAPAQRLPVMRPRPIPVSNRPAPLVYSGASYGFYGPSFYSGSSYGPNYVAPNFNSQRYPDPGPYYYTPTGAYTPGYYSYYYTPGYFRY